MDLRNEAVRVFRRLLCRARRDRGGQREKHMIGGFILHPKIKERKRFAHSYIHMCMAVSFNPFFILRTAGKLCWPKSYRKGGWSARKSTSKGAVHVLIPAHALIRGILGVISASSLASVFWSGAGCKCLPASYPKLTPHTLPNRRPPSKHTPACPDDKGPASKTERP